MTDPSRLPATPAVLCKNLHKQFADGTQALEGISLQIMPGTLFGLIGADGAGKTTLIRILATLLKPTQGTAELLGKDVVTRFRSLRHQIGYMPGRFSLYPDLSVRENLNIFATLYDTTIEANYDLISEIYEQIAPFAKRPAGKLSGGMKQKLALCCALVHRPDILLLDEPTTGVDPVSRKVFWQILVRLKEEEKLSIIVSTPYMDEAILCDEIALLSQGHIIAEGQPHALIASYPSILWAAKASDKGALLQAFREEEGVVSAYSFGDKLHFTTDSRRLDIAHLRSHLRANGFPDVVIEPISPSIEDYFLWKVEAEETEKRNE